jgi:Ca-activated chloride channel family protein
MRHAGRWSAIAIAWVLLTGSVQRSGAQENPLDDAHTKAPAPVVPKDARPVISGADIVTKATSARGSSIRVDVNMVLVPVTVTDPMNRLVTGLERENFQLYDNNTGEKIKSFATEDAPLSIGIVFDLSGSMQGKFNRARKALSAFLRTCNPLDEFFVVGFNDRPAIIVDYTSDVEDVEARMVMLRPQNRTALIDAMYLAVDKLKSSKYERKAMLVISDGGDNRSRYTEGELTRTVRESEVQIFSMGIFDEYASTDEERNGPLLLNGLAEATGGRMYKCPDIDVLNEVAEKISQQLRDEYVLGYTPTDRRRDGTWRKLKVRLVPPPGLPELTPHSREGYYAPSQ